MKIHFALVFLVARVSSIPVAQLDEMSPAVTAELSKYTTEFLFFALYVNQVFFQSTALIQRRTHGLLAKIGDSSQCLLRT